jgi:UDP-N-acetyl-D-galactosamine dehydrogenase
MVSQKIAVFGMGYIGLPVGLALAEVYPDVVGYDIDARKIDELSKGFDRTGETEDGVLAGTKLKFTASLDDVKGATTFIVAVPTPIDQNRQPDLSFIESATESIGKILQKDSVVIYESTVYPGVTEDICGPILERVSGLKYGQDFFLGYSPERINPGDKEHTLQTVIKVVSGDTPETLERVAALYGPIIKAGLHKASSIKVAEAAKVIENTQRALNIAFMNELALICDRIDLRTNDVLEAAGTKWNFLRYTPGLVGGHCIGIDPYYLTALCENLGYHPEVILAGRRINDSMGLHVAAKVIKLLAQCNKPIRTARIGILGLSFKENVSDLRNSRVFDIIQELQSYGIEPVVHDPVSDPEQIEELCGIKPQPLSAFSKMHAVILAVAHKEYKAMKPQDFCDMIEPGGIFADVKSAFSPKGFDGFRYWSL